MKRYEVTRENFLKDVAQHRLTILRDDGVYRHLYFGAPDTGNQHFHLITWPGSICYHGDMGTYVFSRVEDMFRFFRADADRPLEINPGYWSEKVDARDRDGVTEWSKERFIENVKQWLDDGEVSDDVREAVDEQVLSRVDDGEQAARAAVYEFNHDAFAFEDFFEARDHVYTIRFVWCCFALVWGISQYDEAKAAAAAA